MFAARVQERAASLYPSPNHHFADELFGLCRRGVPCEEIASLLGFVTECCKIARSARESSQLAAAGLLAARRTHNDKKLARRAGCERRQLIKLPPARDISTRWHEHNERPFRAPLLLYLSHPPVALRVSSSFAIGVGGGVADVVAV
jgi:hypothetical protein